VDFTSHSSESRNDTGDSCKCTLIIDAVFLDCRYSYDPFTQSPNDNPEAELPIHAGDYVLVWGNMDEV